MQYEKQNRSAKRLAFSGILVLLTGCSSRPGAIAPPDVDAADAAAEAITQYDKNGDNALGADELTACPALASALPRYDKDRDKGLSHAEIEAGIERWTTTAVGAMIVPFQVQLDGRGMEGAQVKLTPEKFLNDAIKPATGQAGRGGNGYLGVAPEDRPENAPKMPLVQAGLYRVEITHPSQQIPAKYNSATTLGLEVARDSILPQGVTWALTSK